MFFSTSVSNIGEMPKKQTQVKGTIMRLWLEEQMHLGEP
jgi:hypothetical protein